MLLPWLPVIHSEVASCLGMLQYAIGSERLYESVQLTLRS